MILPCNKKLTITQRLLRLRLKRNQRKKLLIAQPRQPKSGMKYNMGKFTYRDANGILQFQTPTNTFWYNAYIRTPHLDNPKFDKKFRLRFRMPHSSFVEILHEMKHHELFSQWDSSRKIKNNKKRTPMSLLLLGSLRYMGRGWTMDE